MPSPNDVGEDKRNNGNFNKSVFMKKFEEELRTLSSKFVQSAAAEFIARLESSPVMQRARTSGRNVGISSSAVQKEAIKPESKTVLEISPAPEPEIGLNIVSEFDAVSRKIPVSEPVLFETKQAERSVPKQCVEFASVEDSEQNAEVESVVTPDEITVPSCPFFEQATAIESILYSESVPVLETNAVLEEDVGFNENAELESDTVTEIIANSDNRFKRRKMSDLDPISESKVPNRSSSGFETASVSEQNVMISSTSVSKESTQQEAFSALEIAESSEPAVQPRPIKITFSKRTILDLCPDFSVAGPKFCKIFDVSTFDRDSLSVNIYGNNIDVCGIQESENGEECQEIHRYFSIPEIVGNFSACILENDTLVLEASV